MQTRNQKVFCRHVKRLFQKHSEDKQTYIEQDLQIDVQKELSKDFQENFQRTLKKHSQNILVLQPHVARYHRFFQNALLFV